MIRPNTAPLQLIICLLALTAVIDCTATKNEEPAEQDEVTNRILRLAGNVPRQIVDLDKSTHKKIDLSLLFNGTTSGRKIDAQGIQLLNGRVYLSDRLNGLLVASEPSRENRLEFQPAKLRGQRVQQPALLATNDSLLCVFSVSVSSLILLNSSLYPEGTIPLPGMKRSDNLTSPGRYFACNRDAIVTRGSGGGFGEIYSVKDPFNKLGEVVVDSASDAGWLDFVAAPVDSFLYAYDATLPILLELDATGKLAQAIEFRGEPVRELRRPLKGVKVIRIGSADPQKGALGRIFFSAADADENGNFYFVFGNKLYRIRRLYRGEYQLVASYELVPPKDLRLPLPDWSHVNRLISVRNGAIYVLLTGELGVVLKGTIDSPSK